MKMNRQAVWRAQEFARQRNFRKPKFERIAAIPARTDAEGGVGPRIAAIRCRYRWPHRHSAGCGRLAPSV